MDGNWRSRGVSTKSLFKRLELIYLYDENKESRREGGSEGAEER